MTSVARTRLIVAGAAAVVAAIAVGLIVGRAHDVSPPAAPRFSDLYGRVVVTRAAAEPLVGSVVDGRAEIGPAEIRIGAQRVSIPSRTPLYGSGCRFLTESGFFRPRGLVPCFAQVGLRRHRTTARWILVLNSQTRFGPNREKVTSTHWTGTLSEVRGDDIIFTDGVVIPGADARVACPPGSNVRAADLVRHPECGAKYGWGVTIDSATGRAKQLGPVGRM